MGYFKIDTLAKNKSVFNPATSLENTSSYGIWDLTKASIYEFGPTMIRDPLAESSMSANGDT